MNKVRLVIFLIFFAVIGYSLSMSGLVGPTASVPECLEDQGVCYGSTISRVIDGDTIVTSDEQKIQFSLASAPELSEQGGEEAKEFIEGICPAGSKIVIDEDDEQLSGSYGRIIAKVTCNGINLNDQLIEGGHGTIDTRYCSSSEFSNESWATECR
jgi:micrococcal nuclease